MRFPALSVVAPAGDWIREGLKTIEVRSWRPEFDSLRGLLIVQNGHRLDAASPVDPAGVARALVDVVRVRSWLPEDLSASCSREWTEGYFAWELASVRPVDCDLPLEARLGIYEVALPSEALRES